MTVSLEYPGDERFTLLDSQNGTEFPTQKERLSVSQLIPVILENVLKIEIDVKERFRHHKELSRANTKKKDYKTRELRYFYTMELDPTDSDTTLLFINYFVPKTQVWERIQVYALKIDASNYGSHGNMDESAAEVVSIPSIPSLTSVEEIVESSWDVSDQLRKEQEQSAAEANNSFNQVGEHVVDSSEFSLPGQSTLSPVPKDRIDQMWPGVQTQSGIQSTATLDSEAAEVCSLRSTQAPPAAQKEPQGLGFSSGQTPTGSQLENITTTTVPVGYSKQSGLVRFAHSTKTGLVTKPIRGRTRPTPAAVANSSSSKPDTTGFNDKENWKLATKSNSKVTASTLPLPSRRKPLSSISTAPTSNIVRHA